ncbi:MAG: hypothetical protein KDD66_07510 [Bdellovibrionales bacterium]|nr:hypothetical protein [Bdellovibrionales bacterium]
MAASNKSSGSIQKQALMHMLKPLVRYWIRGSNTIQDFVDLLKLVFIQVAVEEMEHTGSKINVSRISVMTGVHRTDVTKVYKQQEEPSREVPDVVSRVIGKWQSDSSFTTTEGKPRIISFGDDNSEFVSLVRSVSKSVSPGSVLFELERCNSVRRSSKGLALVRTTHKVTTDVLRATEIMSKDAESLMSAIHENIESAAEVSPNLHIRTEYDNVFLKDIPKIREWLRVEGKKFHKKARDYLSKFDKDINERQEAAGATVVLTAFSMITEPAAEAATEEEQAA